jgi:hypothetical protein
MAFALTGELETRMLSISASSVKRSFQTALAGALKNVDRSMQRFANDSVKDLTNIVIGSYVTLGVQRPEDPGVAVRFTRDGLGLCIPVDPYLQPQRRGQPAGHSQHLRGTPH